MGHMNVMWYVGKFDEATWNPSRSSCHGLLPSRQCGARWGRAAEHHLQARAAVGRRGRRALGMLEIRDKVAKFVHEMRDAQTGEVSAVCVLTVVHMDGKARKSIAFPSEVAARPRRCSATTRLER